MNKVKELAKIRDAKLALLCVGDIIECVNPLNPVYFNEISRKEFYYECEQVYKINKNNIYTTWSKLEKMNEFSICVKIPKSQIRLNKYTGNLCYSCQRAKYNVFRYGK